MPPSFPQLVARLIRSPNVTINGNATLDGNRAVSITSLHGRARSGAEQRLLFSNAAWDSEPAWGPGVIGDIVLR